MKIEEKMCSIVSLKINHGTKGHLLGFLNIQILLRYYFLKRDIFLNGLISNILAYAHYLSSFGLVSQEPPLLDGSFCLNIQYNFAKVSE
jgi:hypothetical protein